MWFHFIMVLSLSSESVSVRECERACGVCVSRQFNLVHMLTQHKGHSQF